MARKDSRKNRSNRKDYRKSRKANRRNRTRKNMRGGGWGFTGTGSIPGTPGTVSNPQVFTAIGDCRAAEPGYWIPQSSYSTYQKGLPGMNGGGKRRRRRTMKGGRYGFAPDMIPGVTPNGAAWWAGTYGPIQRIACEGSTPNPLNPGPHTPSTQPLPVASSSIPMPQGGGSRRRRRQRGGAQTLAPMSVGVGNVDSMYYYGPTAGYANQASTWVDSVGAPVQIQIPYAARAMNQACLTTGGHPPLTGALQKGGGPLNFLGNLATKAKNAAKGVTNTIGLTKAQEVSSLLGVKNENYANPPAASAPMLNLTPAPPAPSAPMLNLTPAPAVPLNNDPKPLNTNTSRTNNAKKNTNTNTNSHNLAFRAFQYGGKRKGRKGKSRKGKKHH